MADLLTELKHLGESARSRSAVAGAAAAAADPVLLDDVYTCPSNANSQDGSSAAARWGAKSCTLPSPTSTTATCCCTAAGVGAVTSAIQASSCSFTSGTSLTSLAALAAYRRQLYLGLDPANPAAGGAGARPVSATAPLQTGRRSFALKSRPNGMPSPDWGPCAHPPGYLPPPEKLDTTTATTAAAGTTAEGVALGSAAMSAAATGMAGPLAQTRLHPRSCCPPPWPEPLAPAVDSDGNDTVAERLAEREQWDEGELINKLVYDSLQPPVAQVGVPVSAAAAAGNSSWSSSCRTTTSSKSLDSSSGGIGGGDGGTSGGASTPADTTCGAQSQQPPCYDYAPGLTPWYQPEGPGDTTLVFESRFECGNLRRAIQVAPWEYDLVLQPDINTRGHTQWFFFAVSNMRPGRRYSFNIINLLKEDSLYNMGMLPLLHSEQQMGRKGIGWVRCGHNVCYGANSIVCRKKATYYTLHFEVEFPHDKDLVHLAHCYPFTWTDQQNHIYALKQSLPSSTILQHSVLATSLAGNAVDLLTITAAADRGLKPMHLRQGVVLSARVHPGETNSSWMMKGALQQLLADTQEAQALREAFVFKVVPMLNPDGVIVGNYRCSLAGLDLNRVYQSPDARLQPVICAFKEMVRAFTQEREVILSCDMHGHSRRFGIFMYGCEKKPGKDVTPLGPGLPVPGSLGGLSCVPARHQERIFPLMLALNAPDLFSYRACNFKVQKSKAGTGRVVGFRELGLVNAYTMEASFAGAAVDKYAKQHFNTGHLEEMGAAVVRTLLDYWAPPELNSAPDLCSQLDAALLSGVADGSCAPSSSSYIGVASSSTAAAAAAGGGCPALEKLGLLAEGGDEEDVCTDSDDESSDDDKPSPAATARAAAIAAAAAAAAATTAATTSSSSTSNASLLADLSKQLADMLSGTQFDCSNSNNKAAGGTKGAARAGAGAAVAVLASSAAADAVRTLLEAIRAAEGVGSSSSSSVSLTPAQGAVGQQGSSAIKAQVAAQAATSGVSSSSSSSSAKQPTASPAKAVTAAAQQLLDKLAAAKAKQAAAAAAAACSASAGNATAVCAVSSGAAANGFMPPAASVFPAATASGTAAVAAGTVAGAAAVVTQHQQPAAASAAGATSVAPAATLAPPPPPAAAAPTVTAAAQTSLPLAPAPAPAAVAAAPAAAAPAAAAAPPAAAAAVLTEEEAALLVIPGLQGILQQLVQAAAQHKSKAAADKAKKKGRRKGRWGNPEVLRAARAKADAGLAAALPELGIMLDDADGGAGDDDDAASDTGVGCWHDGGGSCSSTSTPATPTVPETPVRLPFAGRRAQTAGSSKGSLNVERYMRAFELQRQAAGGVLAVSSTDWGFDPPGGGGGLAACLPGSNTTNSSRSSPMSSSKSMSYGSKKAVAFAAAAAAAAEYQPDALEAVVAAGAAGTARSPVGADNVGSPPGVLQRRSRSAYPWIEGSGGSQRPSS